MIKEEDKELFIEQYKTYMLYQTKASFASGKRKQMYELAAIANLLSIYETRKKIQSYNPDQITEESNFFDLFAKIQIFKQLKNGNIEDKNKELLDNVIKENQELKNRLNSIEKRIG